MDERAAREVVLVQAIETTDRDRKLLGEEESLRASRSAKDLILMQAAGDRAAVTPDRFLHTRAELLLNGLGHRHPALAALRKPGHWPGLVAVVLPIAALLMGALTERISNPHRMDLLSLPLLGILAWNLLIYLALIVAAVLPRRAHRKWPGLPKMSWLNGRHPFHGRQAPPVAAAAGSFALQWQRLCSPLAAARWKRILHLAAALFGLGVAASLYARGLIVEYRVGWESTFLDAGQVRALLNTLFAPVAALSGLPPFSTAEVADLRFGASGGAAGGARWVHLYASLLTLVVVLPRLALAAIARWQEVRLGRAFPLDLEQPYMRKLLGAISPAPLVLRVLPYSFAIDETRDRGLKALAISLLGDTAQVTLRPSCAYGAEPQEALAGTQLADDRATMTAALFNLSATPEKENHGAFIQYLARALPGKVTLLLDTSAYAGRLGNAPDAALRIEERKRLWQTFADLYRLPLTFVDLNTHAERQ